ncbi:MAG: Dam family site-specific DNA-(adenine-N6)-methyltransferase [Legionella sp.]
MTKTRPFLKWAGNKFRCIEYILNTLPQADRLVEPFTGSASIFINSNYPNYLLGENNLDLVHLFNFVKAEGEDFISLCQQLFTPQNNCAEQYYLLRDEFNNCGHNKRRAALFLYLNRHGYNGLCRYNSKGYYNVPFGSHKKPYFPKQEMLSFVRKSSEAIFLHNDFQQTFAMAEKGDLIYCDPPYAPRDQLTNFTDYTEKKFGEQEQITLANLAMTYAERGITVAISNHDTAFTRHYYRFGKIHCFEVKRSISRNANNRQLVKELLVIFR